MLTTTPEKTIRQIMVTFDDILDFRDMLKFYTMRAGQQLKESQDAGAFLEFGRKVDTVSLLEEALISGALLLEQANAKSGFLLLSQWSLDSLIEVVSGDYLDVVKGLGTENIQAEVTEIQVHLLGALNAAGFYQPQPKTGFVSKQHLN